MAKAKTFILGVTGHRNIDMADKALAKRITQELRILKGRHEGAEFILLSGLAEGADRLVAKLAQKKLRAKLVAVLAVPQENFMMDFADAKSKRAFKTLLGKADHTITAPLLSKQAWQDYSPGRNNQYAWIGAFIAVHAHYLFAIWDGKPARGRGGTAEVVRWFKGGRIPKLMLTNMPKLAKTANLKKRPKRGPRGFIHIKV